MTSLVPQSFIPGYRLQSGTDLNEALANPQWSTTMSLEATTGGTADTSVKIVTTLTNITSATANAGVTIPRSAIGRFLRITNSTANTIKVYAEGDATINGAAGSIGYSLNAGQSASFYGVDAVAWQTSSTSGSSDSSYVSNVDVALRAVTPTAGGFLDVGGYYAAGDGGGGQFYAVTTGGPYNDNGGTVITFGGVSGASSAWIRIYSSPINIRWFGAKGVASIGASVTSVDDTAAIQAACDVGSNAVYIPQGWFVVKNAITLTSVGSGYVFGEGRASVVLLADPKAQFIVDGPNVTIRDLTMVTRLATANTVMASTDPAKNAVIYVEGPGPLGGRTDWEFDNIFMFNYVGLLSTGIKTFNATCGLVKNCSVNFPELYGLWFTGSGGGQANAINVVGGNYRGAKVAGIFWENGLFNLITGATVQTGAYVAGQAGIYIKNSQVNVNGCYIEFPAGIPNFTGSIAYDGTNSILTATTQPNFPSLLLSAGQAVQVGAGTGILDDTYIVSQITSTEPGGALGGRGTYLLTGPSQTVASTSLRAQTGYSYVLDNAINCSIISQSGFSCQCGYLITNGSNGNTISGTASENSIRIYQIDSGCSDNTIFTGSYVRANLVVDNGTRTTIFANGGFWGGTAANPGIKFDYQQAGTQNVGFYYSGSILGASINGSSVFSASSASFDVSRAGTTFMQVYDTSASRNAYYLMRTTAGTWRAGPKNGNGTIYEIFNVNIGSDSNVEYIQAAQAGTDETALLLRVDRAGTKTLSRVSIGAADSGGTGFRLLRVAN